MVEHFEYVRLVEYHDVDWERDEFAVTVAITGCASEQAKYRLSHKLRSSTFSPHPEKPLLLVINMYNSPFTVAGMSSSTNAHHNPNLNTWGSTSTGGPLTSSFSDSLAQSRSHYQSGYLMV